MKNRKMLIGCVPCRMTCMTRARRLSRSFMTLWIGKHQVENVQVSSTSVTASSSNVMPRTLSSKRQTKALKSCARSIGSSRATSRRSAPGSSPSGQLTTPKFATSSKKSRDRKRRFTLSKPSARSWQNSGCRKTTTCTENSRPKCLNRRK